MENNRVIEFSPSTSKFIWKISNFSKLVNDEYYSNIFLAGGCKWRVLIYPKGINGYLSIFLYPEDVAKSPYAEFRFSVHNRINDMNTKSLDANHQFTTQQAWGFIWFMPLDMLNDPDQGYLVDDTFFVEVEVSACIMMENSTDDDSTKVSEGSLQTIYQLVELSPCTKFIWKIENFSMLGDNGHYSEIFFAGGCKWRVRIFPKGNSSSYLSIFLYTEDLAKLPYADYNIEVLNQFYREKTVRGSKKHQFTTQLGWGFTWFMPLPELHDPAQGYLVNDTCFVVVDISACSMMDHSTDDSIKVAEVPVKVATPVAEKNLVEVSNTD